MARKIPPRRVPRDREQQRAVSSGSIFGGSSIPGAHTHVEADITDLGNYAELGGALFTDDIRVSSIVPRFRLVETDAAADNKQWDIFASNEQFRIRALNDARSAGTSAIEIDRTGIVIDKINFNGTSLQHNGVNVFLASGGTLTGNLTISSVSPRFRLTETDATIDEGRWDIAAQGDELRIRTISDDGSSSIAVMTVTRTGTTVDSIDFESTLLKHNGVNVFLASGGALTGLVTFDDFVRVNNDTKKFTVGINNDGQFYHDGTNTYFQSTTGDMRLYSTAATGLMTFWTNTTLALTLDASQGAAFRGAVGFNTAAPLAKPTITGSAAGNAALASLLTALASYGLITDSSS